MHQKSECLFLHHHLPIQPNSKFKAHCTDCTWLWEPVTSQTLAAGDPGEALMFFPQLCCWESALEQVSLSLLWLCQPWCRCISRDSCMYTVYPGPQSTALSKDLQVPCLHCKVKLYFSEQAGWRIVKESLSIQHHQHQCHPELWEMNNLRTHPRLPFQLFLCVWVFCLRLCILGACLVHTQARKGTRVPGIGVTDNCEFC